MEPIKQQLYPKTKRVGSRGMATITEKLDGSNLGFFKYEADLWVAQRNLMYKWDGTNNQWMYKGLFGWLEENGSDLAEELQEDACIFGEWIGMGRISYGDTVGKFNMFAKANVHMTPTGLAIKNLYYEDELFKWSFVSQGLPKYISYVPYICACQFPTVSDLDYMYDGYTEEVGRDVEGFIIHFNGAVSKYVRMKNGTLAPHEESK